MFSRSVVSDSLQPRGSQHTKLPCPSPSPRICSNSCPLSQWCHLTISSSVAPFSFCPQSFPASVFFNELALWIRRPRYWSFGFSPSNEYLGPMSFRIDWFDSLKSKNLSCSPTPQFEGINISHSAFYTVQLSYPHMTTGKPKLWTYRPFLAMKCFCFLIQGRFVVAFLSGSKHLLISWLQSLFTVILETKKTKSVTVSIVSSFICREVIGPGAMIFFLCWVLSQLFHSPLSPLSRGSLIPLRFLLYLLIPSLPETTAPI